MFLSLRLRKAAVLWLGLASAVAAHGQAGDEAPATATDNVAERPEFALWASSTQSDNIERTPDGVRGTYDSVGVFFNAARESTRMSGAIDSDLEHRLYSDEVADDETLGTLQAFADFDLVDDVFIWGFRETYDQGQTDPFAPPSPDNRENLNVFSTGPRLDIPVAARMRLTVLGDYSSRRYEDSNLLDSDAELYELALSRQIRTTASLGLLASTNETEYDYPVVAPDQIDRLSLRYARDFSEGE